MTNLEKIKKIQALVKRRSTDGSHKDGRKLLISEGILERRGELSPEYGGKRSSGRKRTIGVPDAS